MNTDETEQRLRELFHEQRHQDARQTPGFARLTAPAPVCQRPASWATVPWVRFAAAAALIVAGLFIVRPGRGPTAPAEPDWTRWAALSEWRAPSDSLVTVSLPSASSAFTTPSDAWLSSLAAGSAVPSSNNAKETL